MYGSILLPLSFQAINLQQPYYDNDSIYKIVCNRKYKTLILLDRCVKRVFFKTNKISKFKTLKASVCVRYIVR